MAKAKEGVAQRSSRRSGRLVEAQKKADEAEWNAQSLLGRFPRELLAEVLKLALPEEPFAREKMRMGYAMVSRSFIAAANGIDEDRVVISSDKGAHRVKEKLQEDDKYSKGIKKLCVQIDCESDMRQSAAVRQRKLLDSFDAITPSIRKLRNLMSLLCELRVKSSHFVRLELDLSGLDLDPACDLAPWLCRMPSLKHLYMQVGALSTSRRYGQLRPYHNRGLPFKTFHLASLETDDDDHQFLAWLVGPLRMDSEMSGVITIVSNRQSLSAGLTDACASSLDIWRMSLFEYNGRQNHLLHRLVCQECGQMTVDRMRNLYRKFSELRFLGMGEMTNNHWIRARDIHVQALIATVTDMPVSMEELTLARQEFWTLDTVKELEDACSKRGVRVHWR